MLFLAARGVLPTTPEATYPFPLGLCFTPQDGDASVGKRGKAKHRINVLPSSAQEPQKTAWDLSTSLVSVITSHLKTQESRNSLQSASTDMDSDPRSP